MFFFLSQTEHGIQIVKVTPDTRGLETIKHPDGKIELKFVAFPCAKCNLEFKRVS